MVVRVCFTCSSCVIENNFGMIVISCYCDLHPKLSQCEQSLALKEKNLALPAM